MKNFTASQFAYCPLIWIFHGKTLTSNICQVNGRALCVSHKDYKSSLTQLIETQKFVQKKKYIILND